MKVKAGGGGAGHGATEGQKRAPPPVLSCPTTSPCHHAPPPDYRGAKRLNNKTYSVKARAGAGVVEQEGAA